jgi:phage tail-like protein
MPTIELPALYVNSVIALTGIPRPSLINRDPGPDETEVPLDSTVALEIVDSGSAGVDRDQTHIWVDGVLAFEGGATEEMKASFSGPREEVFETADTLRIVLDPQTAFSSQAQVQIHVVSATNDGQSLDQTYFFFAEDLTRPKLVAAQAIGQQSVRMSFDEPILKLDQQGFSIEPLTFPAVVPKVIEAFSDGQVVELLFDTEMTPDVDYRVTVTGVVDLKENLIDPAHNTVVFKGFVPQRPGGRLFDLWSMIPIWNRREDLTGDLRRFIDCLQEALDWLLAEVDRFPDIFDLERAPESFLNLILDDLGNPFPFNLDELAKRRLASVLVEMYRQKGTAIGIENAIRFFLGIDITAITPFAGSTLILGESELGVDWELGPSDRFARYAFNVEVDVPLTNTERKRLRTIVDYLKPAHTHFVDLLEPSAPIEYDHWVIGISELGMTTDLH